MAKVKNAFTTYNAVGNREDLSGTIYNIDPFDTPTVSLAGKRPVSNRTYDWQTEKLPAVNGNNARQEGFELDRSAGTPTTRLRNVAQISSRDATVTGSQEEADAAGKPSEMGRQMALQGKALKRDMEVIFCSAQPINYGDDSANPVPRNTRGVLHWLKTNVFYPQPTPGTVKYTPPATESTPYPAVATADQVVFTEALLGKLMARCYNNGAEPSIAVLGPTLKRTFSTFQGRATSQVLVGKTEVVATVDVYASDFGRIKVLPSRWIDPNVVLLADPSYMKVASYRNFQTTDIAKIGDADTKLMLAEWGTEVGNEAAHGLLVGVAAPSNLDPNTMG
jgi:hypothetical protein